MITIRIMLNFHLKSGYREWRKDYQRKKLRRNSVSKASLPTFNIKKEKGYRLNIEDETEKAVDFYGGVNFHNRGG
ncbi:hypothetical protein ABE068_18210 [Bacillus glycinifermentans]|uniref:Uncharacterized protein n=1 Tax=Bacillus glycinifermentans TaxID=1664069 RepID=A0A0T6BN77_9BACI|nr:hypothetical protein [Bacillus glycinifermentans]KRT93108.1 hypothetical protein AB447_204015 [Bacillus glycinifermentans]MEC0487918.1 hypothetical protein [Bacillus glycinifermentans]